MKITISERGRKAILADRLLRENNYQEMSKIVNRYLDGNFVRADNLTRDGLGKPERQQCVLWKDSNGQPVDDNPVTDQDLFYILQDRFKDMISDKDERDKFLGSAIRNWYHGTNKW